MPEETKSPLAALVAKSKESTAAESDEFGKLPKLYLVADVFDIPERFYATAPQYTCHKVVGAFVIKGIDLARKTLTLIDNDGDYVQLMYPNEIRERFFDPVNHPQAGDYYVIYAGDYQSRSPAEVFEEGYTRNPTTA